jgi:hypothetical protein
MNSNWTSWMEVHDLILIGVVLLLFGTLGGGPLLKALINWFLKIIGRGTSETIINLNSGGEMADNKPQTCKTCTATDPTSCPLHQSEHERSLRNEKNIEDLSKDLRTTRTQLFGKLEGIEAMLNDVKVAVGQLIVKTEFHKGKG